MIKVGKDPAGNIQRITNTLAGIEKELSKMEQRLETLQQQLKDKKAEQSFGKVNIVYCGSNRNKFTRIEKAVNE